MASAHPVYILSVIVARSQRAFGVAIGVEMKRSPA
jgi:hypothetical protein